MSFEALASPLAVDGDRPHSVPAPEVPTDAAFEELVAIGAALSADEVDLDRVLALVVERASALLHTDVAWIARFEHDSAEVRVHVSHGTLQPDFDRMKVPFGQGLGGTVLDLRRTLVITDYPSYEHDTEPFVRDVMAREGVTSVMCAPMSRGAHMVGALYVANRRSTRFSSSHASLLSTLAAQASIALENRRLYHEQLAKMRLLEETFEIHHRLGEAAVSDLGVEGVLRTLAGLTGRVLRLEQNRVPPFVAAVAADGTPPSDEACAVLATIVPIALHGRQVGHISVYGVDPLRELETNALTHGATVLTLELMKHEAAHEAEWRLRGELLEDLLASSTPPDDALLARAHRVGLDLDAPAQMLVVEAEPEVLGRLEAHARRPRRGGTVLVASRPAHLLIATIGTPGSDLVASVERELAGARALMGVSSRGHDFAAALREAQACVAFARRSPARPAVVEHEGLGALRFMLDAGEPDQSRSLVRERLGRVADYDRRMGTSLLETLRAYLECDGHHPSVARRCHVHRSTVKYRLGRLAELLPSPLTGAEAKFELLLAFRLLELFRARNEDLLAMPAPGTTSLEVEPFRGASPRNRPGSD